MEKLISDLLAIGGPSLLLKLMMDATGHRGAARLTTALSALGPGGMVGGLLVLAISGLATREFSETMISAAYCRVVQQLLADGESPEDVLEKIQGYPVSTTLKKRLENEVLANIGA